MPVEGVQELMGERTQLQQGNGREFPLTEAMRSRPGSDGESFAVVKVEHHAEQRLSRV